MGLVVHVVMLVVNEMVDDTEAHKHAAEGTEIAERRRDRHRRHEEAETRQRSVIQRQASAQSDQLKEVSRYLKSRPYDLSVDKVERQMHQRTQSGADQQRLIAVHVLHAMSAKMMPAQRHRPRGQQAEEKELK